MRWDVLSHPTKVYKVGGNIRSRCEIRPKFTTRGSKSGNGFRTTRHWFIPGTRAKVVGPGFRANGIAPVPGPAGGLWATSIRVDDVHHVDGLRKRGIVRLSSHPGPCLTFHPVTPSQLRFPDLLVAALPHLRLLFLT